MTKKDELLSKAGRSSPGQSGDGERPSGGASERATSAITQLQSTARANPVPTAALGALIGGFLLGRLTGRGE